MGVFCDIIRQCIFFIFRNFDLHGKLQASRFSLKKLGYKPNHKHLLHLQQCPHFFRFKAVRQAALLLDCLSRNPMSTVATMSSSLQTNLSKLPNTGRHPADKQDGRRLITMILTRALKPILDL